MKGAEWDTTSAGVEKIVWLNWYRNMKTDISHHRHQQENNNVSPNPPQSAHEKVKVLGKDFFSNTSMHGLKYIGEDQRHVCERLAIYALYRIKML